MYLVSDSPRSASRRIRLDRVVPDSADILNPDLNVGTTNAVAIASLSSQNPGVITIANAVFGSKPAISADVLRKAFQVDKNVVEYLQSQFWGRTHHADPVTQYNTINRLYKYGTIKLCISLWKELYIIFIIHLSNKFHFFFSSKQNSYTE